MSYTKTIKNITMGEGVQSFSHTRKFIAQKGNSNISVEPTSSNGLTITVENNGKFTSYMLDANELKEFLAWSDKNCK